MRFLGRLRGHLQPRTPPQPMRPAGAHAVAVAPEKDADAAIAVARILRRQLLHPLDHGRVLRRLAAPGSSTPITPPRTACRPAVPRDHAPGHTQLAAGEPAHLPVFCGDFLHHLDLEITFGDQLLQPRILVRAASGA